MMSLHSSFFEFQLQIFSIFDFWLRASTQDARIGANPAFDLYEQIMAKMVDFPIPEAGKSPNIGHFDLT